MNPLRFLRKDSPLLQLAGTDILLQTAEGIAIVDLLRGYSLHALTRQRLTAKAA